MNSTSTAGAGQAPLIYEDAYYQRISALEQGHWWYAGMRKAALAILASHAFPERPVVLDAGCGTGGVMAWISEALGAGQVHGIDIAPAAVADAERFGRGALGSVSVGSVCEIPFPDGRFDLVLSNDVIQHLPTAGHDGLAVAEMARVLAPGGALLIRSNSRLGMRQGAEARDFDYQRYTLQEVAELARRAGLSVRRSTYANFVGGVHESLRRRIRPARTPQAGSHHGEPHGSHAHERTVYEGYGVRDTARINPLVNTTLKACMSAEARLLRTTDLGFGHSTFVLAVKPR